MHVDVILPPADVLLVNRSKVFWNEVKRRKNLRTLQKLDFHAKDTKVFIPKLWRPISPPISDGDILIYEPQQLFV